MQLVFGLCSICSHLILPPAARLQLLCEVFPVHLNALPHIRHAKNVKNGGDATANAYINDGSVEHGDDGDKDHETRNHLKHPDHQVESNCNQVSLSTAFAIHVCNSFN